MSIDFSRWVRPELLSLKPYASARTIAAGTKDPVDLSANENPWPVDATCPLNRYPDPQPPELVAALADHYRIDPAWLLITRGSDEGIDLLNRLLVRPGKDGVMVNSPCFGMYALYATIQGAEVVDVPAVEGRSDWAMDWPAVNKAPECRLYFFCSPNNPTGHTLSPVDVLAFAKRVESHGVVVIDEAYVEFGQSDSMASLIDHQPNLVVLRTLSKAFGLAGARLGAVIAHPELIAWLKRIIAPYPLPTPSVDAALHALSPKALAQQETQLASLANNKACLVAALSAMPTIERVWPGEANFVLVKVADADALMRHCLADGIRLRNQSHQPKLNQAVRITVGTEQETEKLIASLQRFDAQNKSIKD